MKHIILPGILLAAAMAFSSCSVLEGLNKKGTTPASATETQPATVTQTAPVTQSAPVTAQNTVPVQKTQTDQKPQVTKKTQKSQKDRKNKKANAAVTMPSRENHPATSAALEKELEGEWIIVGAGSKVINRDEDMPYIYFVPEEHRFYGSNGCNILNGIYSVSADKITFSNVLSTMKYCPETDFDADVNMAIQDGKTVGAYVKKIGNESYLYLNNSAGKALLTLCRHNLNFLDGNWMVTQINGHSVNDEECNVFFDIKEGKIHGNTGCNYFNGTITMDPVGANSINFSGMGVTRMACPKGDQERMMLVALEEVTTAVMGDTPNSAILMDGSGKQALVLKRIPVTIQKED